MPTGKCSNCGGETNSTTSNWWDDKNFGRATECYAKHDGEKWVKGCAFEKLGKQSFQRTFALKLIKPKEKAR